MNELPKKNPESEIRDKIILTARDPVLMLERNKDKGCDASIKFLRLVKNELRKDSSFDIKDPDKDFLEFYTHGNANQLYYDALVSMLKRAGYERDEVTAAFMDNTPIGSTSPNQSVGTAFIQLTEEAIKKIYG